MSAKISPEVAQNLADLLSAFWVPVYLSAYVIALILVGVGLYNLSKEGKAWFAWACIVIGALMADLPGFLDIMSFTLLAEEAPKELTYTSSSTENAVMITLSIRAIMLVGLMALIRSALHFKDYFAEQRSQLLYRGLTFFFGGIAGMNVIDGLKILGNSLGGDVSYIVNLLI